MSKFKQIQKDLMSSVKDSTKAKTKPYDATANVTRIEDGVMYVHIPGGIDETPVEMTINAMPGDLVKVRVANGRAWVTGNHTAPPTDDTTANNAARVARKAQRVAVQASEEAAEAWTYAGTAAEAAVAAKTSADSAHEAAENAWDRAGEAHQAALEAQVSAADAKDSARSANASANNALVQLSVVEDVAGTLRWISEHGDYVLTNDDHVYSDTVYFIKQGGDYVPIASPDLTKNPAAEGWYVLDVTQSTTDYIMAHLAVTSYGLWVLPVNNLAGHYLKDSDGNQIIDSNGNELVDFSDDPQHASGYKVLISGGSNNPDFPIGLSIFNDEGALVARYGLEIILGNKDGGEGYALYDYHSMQLYPPGGGTPYFHVSDLRNRDGVATLTQPFQIVKNTSFTYTTISLRAYPVELLKVEVEGVDVTGDSTVYTQHTGYPNEHQIDFYFAALPNDVNNVSVTFTTEEAIIAYTFGRRRETGEWPTGVGDYSVAEGKNNIASGPYTHAEGLQTEALGYASHTEGQGTRAAGSYSHAQNFQTVAGYSDQTVIGRYNENKAKNALEIGNGSNSSRSNAFEVDWDGNVVCNSMDCGLVSASDFGSVAAGGSREYQLTFNKTFTSVPVVVAGFFSSSTAGSGLGSCTVTVHSITTTGCTLKIFNNDSTSARNPAVSWIAMLT